LEKEYTIQQDKAIADHLMKMGWKNCDPEVVRAKLRTLDSWYRSVRPDAKPLSHRVPKEISDEEFLTEGKKFILHSSLGQEEQQQEEQPPDDGLNSDNDGDIVSFQRSLHEGKYIKPLQIRLEGMVCPYETLVTSNHVYVYFSKTARCDYEMGVCFHYSSPTVDRPSKGSCTSSQLQFHQQRRKD
jgi:hypothetical protein